MELRWSFLGGQELIREKAQPYFRFPQRLLSPLALGDVGHGDTAARPALGSGRTKDLQQHDPQVPLDGKVKLPLQFLPASKVFQQPAQDPAVRFVQKVGKEAFQELAAFHPQHGGGSEVGLHDLALGVQGQEAHRCEVEEVGVSAAGFLQQDLGLPDFLVLHLKLDLVHPEFVDEAGGFGRGELLGVRFRL
jgi:hypothetical protein